MSAKPVKDFHTNHVVLAKRRTYCPEILSELMIFNARRN